MSCLTIRHRLKKRNNYKLFKRILDKKKPRSTFVVGVKNRAGIVLLSHTLTRAIPSPQESLTSEFGMGSGVTSLL